MARTPDCPGPSPRPVATLTAAAWSVTSRAAASAVHVLAAGPRRTRRYLRFRLGLDGNPLRRPSDRREATVLTAAAVFVLAAVAASIVAGVITGQLRWATHEHQRAARHQVNAVVTAIPDLPAWATPTAEVAWPEHDGRSYTGIVPLGLNTQKGGRVTIWVDAADRTSRPPVSASDAVADGVGVAMAVQFAALLLAATGYLLARRRIDAARYRDWDAEWRQLNRRPYRPTWPERPADPHKDF